MNRLRYGLGAGAAVVASALAGLCTPASAQSAGPDMSGMTGMPAYQAISTFGQNLAKQGIFLTASYDETVSALVAGGNPSKHGIFPVGQGSAGAVFDLQTMFGLPGSSFHITFDQRSGLGVAPYGGPAATSALLQYDQEPLNWSMSDFYWEQGFDHDRLDILVGRTQPTTDFMFSDVSCAPISSIICAQPGTFYFMMDNAPFGWSHWGGRVNFQITPEVYIRGGAYDDNPSQATWSSTGFNWSFQHSVGTFFPFELGYQTNFKSAAYPAKYDIGFYQDTGTYTRLNGTEGRDRQAFWAQAEQTVWRPDRATNQSLTAFAGLIEYSGNGPFWGQYYGGLYDRAPFGAVRPRDTIIAIATMYKDNVNYIPLGHTNQWAMELNYAASIIPGVTLTPLVQYVINPDNPTGVISPTFRPHNDVVIGFQIAISPTAIFGFPEFVPH